MFKLPVCSTCLVILCDLAMAGCGGGGGGDGGGSPASPPVIAAFSASPADVLVGGTTTLTWSVSGASSVSISPGIGAVTGTSATVTPAGPMTYTLTATNAAGTATSSAAVAVGVPPTGGTIVAGPARIVVPASTAIGRLDFQATLVDPPAGLPAGAHPVGRAIQLTLGAGQAAHLNGPVEITLQYDAASVADASRLSVARYDTTKGTWGPVTLLAKDTANHTITFQTRAFSLFAFLDLLGYALPSSYFVPDFDPGVHGWDVANFGNYYAPGGNCLGMAAYTVWFFQNRGSDNLYLHFPRSTDGWPYVADLTIQRAHLAQSQLWAKLTGGLGGFVQGIIAPELLMLELRYNLAVWKRPLVFLFRNVHVARHAGVLFGYDEGNFYFYDTNFPGETHSVTWNGMDFGLYGSYTGYGFVADPDLGRTEDFEALTQEAEAGFPGSSDLAITSPRANTDIAAHEATLSGTVAQEGATDVLAYIMGVEQRIPIQGGQFSATIPIASGSNSIAVLAGAGLYSLSNWYHHALCQIFTVKGTLNPSLLLATLTWEQDGADVDLYVTDPAWNTAWYHLPTTGTGLNLDFDNTSGYGPEHVTLSNSSQPLDGSYSVDVHYFSGDRPISGKVAIVTYEGQSNANMRIVPFSLSSSSTTNKAPGSTGPDWAHIATVDLVNNVIE